MCNENKTKPVRVLFVCLGNICRSPMAEAVMARKVKEAGLSAHIQVDSAGTAGYHVGESPDKRMRQFAYQRGYSMVHSCRRVCSDDFENFDFIIGMDHSNVADLEYMAPTVEGKNKIYRMADFFTRFDADHVPDPYYGGADGFRLVIDLLEDACEELLRRIVNNNVNNNS